MTAKKERAAMRKAALRARRSLLAAMVCLSLALLCAPIGRTEKPAIRDFGGHGTAVSVDAVLRDSQPGGVDIPSVSVRDDIVNIDPDTGWVGKALAPEYQLAMQAACAEHGLSYPLALAVCQAASGFDPDARNGRAVGLMQIDEGNREALAGRGYDMDDPCGNIRAGVAMLSDCFAAVGNTNLALMRYHMGPYRSAQAWDAGIHSTDYSVKVTAYALAWDELLSRPAQ